MPPAPTSQQLDRALGRLKVLTPTQAIRDPELDQALAPFRGHPPIALLCGNASCTTPFLWCALDPTSARVRFSAHGPPADADADTGTQRQRSAERRPAPFDDWDLGPSGGEAAGESIALPGEPLLRWRFRCPRCDRPCVLANDRMIGLILRALTAGRGSIRPATD